MIKFVYLIHLPIKFECDRSYKIIIYCIYRFCFQYIQGDIEYLLEYIYLSIYKSIYLSICLFTRISGMILNHIVLVIFIIFVQYLSIN